MSDVAVWHDVECGAYDVDLPLWEELSSEGGEVLDIGCGNGRVALHLARRGRRVTGLDREARLLHTLEFRAQRRGLEVETVHADARAFDLEREFDSVFAPMQFIQLFHGAAERALMLATAVRHVRPGGVFATTLMNLEGELVGDDYGPPPPDMREVDGWVYSSLSIGVRPIERVRTAVSPAGEQSRSRDEVRLELVTPETLEREIAATGLVVGPRRNIPPTEDHVGSIAVVASRPKESA
jgi:SAM-dependent methyltransferase